MLRIAPHSDGLAPHTAYCRIRPSAAMGGNGEDPDLLLLSQFGFLQVDDEEWEEKSDSDRSQELNAAPSDGELDLDFDVGIPVQADPSSSSSSEDVPDLDSESASSAVWRPGESGGPWFLKSFAILESAQALIANVFLNMKTYLVFG